MIFAMRLLLAGWIAATLVAQTASYDNYSYQSPQGYTVREARELRELARVDQQRKFYCQIVLYKAQAGKGSAAADLENEWKYAVLANFNVKGTPIDKPMPLPQAPDSIARVAQTSPKTGGESISNLFILRFPPNYIGIAFHVSNETAWNACQNDIVTLIQSVRWTPVAPSAPAAPTAAAPAPTASSSAGSTFAASPDAPMRNTLLGKWEYRVSSMPAMTYNMFTKQYEYNPVQALNQFQHRQQLIFEAGNRYTKEFSGLNINRQEDFRVVERGTYATAGDVLRLTPQECQSGKAPRDKPIPLAACQLPAPYALRYLLGPHPAANADKTPGLQISEKDNSWSSYKPVQ